MHQRKSKKILIYFYLFILVGSINNIELSSLKFTKINNFNIAGLEGYDNFILLEEIKNLNIGNIFLINRKKITDKINSNSLVEKYDIFKVYPSSLDVKIEKTEFLAKINNNGKLFLVGSNGKLSKNNLNNNQLPYIFGNPKIKEFLNFKKIIDQSKFLYDNIKNIYFYSTKRWDIELNNKIIIKLPQNYIENSLELAFEFLNNQNFKDIKIVDTRVKNQIILND